MTDLLNEALHSEFFAFVRQLEREAYEAHKGAPRKYQPIGGDGAPEREAVRFRVDPSLGFPATPISALSAGSTDETESTKPLELYVTCLGLIGASGVLPETYSAIVLQRQRVRDTVLRNFLDLFHHRVISQFYRAWTKQHLAAHFERSQVAGEPDLFATALFSLAGYGTPQLRNRSDNPDRVVLQYAGHFAHRPRTATALRQILSDYYCLPVDVQQFHGRWLQIAREDRTRLPDGMGRLGQCHRLGADAVLGDRLWDVQSMIRLSIGPLKNAQFRELLPSSTLLNQVAQLARAYLGVELDFDVQLTLAPGEAPTCQLGGEASEQRLGWNCWLGSPAGDSPVKDAVFFAADW